MEKNPKKQENKDKDNHIVAVVEKRQFKLCPLNFVILDNVNC
jgi:hypothetical protein